MSETGGGNPLVPRRHFSTSIEGEPVVHQVPREFSGAMSLPSFDSSYKDTCEEIHVDTLHNNNGLSSDSGFHPTGAHDLGRSSSNTNYEPPPLDKGDSEGWCGTGSLQRKVGRRITKVRQYISDFFTFTPLYRSLEDIEGMGVPTSLFLFKGTNPFRLFCLRTIQYSVFRCFILLCILINSILLALDEPLVNHSDTTDSFLSVMDSVLTCVFVVEMGIKVIALGFVLHGASYLRSGWNILDFIIVVTSVVVSFVDIGANFSALRVIRVLRPLRSINRIAKLKRLISGIFNALPAVADNFFLFVFILFVFAVGGLQLFLDTLSQRCYVTSAPSVDLSVVAPPINVSFFTSLTYPQLDSTEGRYCGGVYLCETAYVQTAADSGVIDLNTTCDTFRSIFTTTNLNFDNFFSAMLLTGKVMTGDNWPDNVQELSDSSGLFKAIPFIILLITVGSFFCVNLFLAILTSSYGDTDGSSPEGGGTMPSHNAQETTVVNTGTRASLSALRSSTFGLLPLKDTGIQCAVETEGPFLEKQLDAIEREFCNVHEEQTRRRVQMLLTARRSPSHSDISNRRGSVAQASMVTFRELPPPLKSVLKPAPSLVVGEGPDRISHQSFILANSNNKQATESMSVEMLDNSVYPLRRVRSQSHSRSRSGPIAAAVSVNSFIGSAVFEPSFSHTRSTIQLDIPTFQEPYDVLFTEDIDDIVVENYHIQRRIEDQQARAIEGGPSVQAQQEAVLEAEDELVDTSDDGSDMESATSGGFSDQTSVSHGFKSTSSMSTTRAASMRKIRRQIRSHDTRSEWRRKLGSWVDSTPVVVFMTVITVLNIVLLMADHYGINTDVSYAFDIVGIVCTCLFGVEISIKIVAFGIFKVLRNKLNILDILLVILAFPDMILSGGSSAFSALRAIRLLRLLRLLKAFPSMQAVFGSAARSVVGSGYLMLLVGLFLFVYAILGMQLFGSFYGVGNDSVRDSYGTFFSALLTSFIVVSGDDWTDKMRAAMSHSTSVLDDGIAVIYFVSLFMIGNYILINLFVAIIMDKLEEEYDRMQQLRVRSNKDGGTDVLLLPTLILPNLASHNRDVTPMSKSTLPSEDTSNPEGKKFADEAVHDYNRISQRLMRLVTWLLQYELVPCTERSLYIFHPDNIIRKVCRVVLGSRLFRIGLICLLVANVVFIAFEGQPAPLSTAVDTSEEIFSGIFIAEMIVNIIAYGLFFPRGVSKVEAIVELHAEKKQRADDVDRRTVASMEEAALTASAVEGLSQQEGSRRDSVSMVDFGVSQPQVSSPTDSLQEERQSSATSSVPTIMLIPTEPSAEFKLLNTPDYKGSWVSAPAYLRDWFNIVDAVVTITSLIGIFVPTFKIFRSLRTIRLLNNIESTRIVLIALIKAVSNVLHGLIVVLFVFIVFGVMGVQFFKGKFFRCNDPSVYLREDCVGNYTAMVQGPLFVYPQETPRSFERLDINFDNIGYSFVSIFVIAVGDGWSHLMYNGMDTTSEGNGLRFEASNFYATFFVVAFMCTNFFALNMIVGILISYFSKMKEENDGSLILTPKQRMFLKARSAIEASMKDVDIDPANNRVSKAVHWFINVMLPQPEKCTDTSVDGHSNTFIKVRDGSFAVWRFFTRQSIFDYAIMFVVILNTTLLATVQTDMTDSHTDVLNAVNNAALYIFTAEALIKLIAYFPAQYFLVTWNVFDFLIVAIGWVDFALPGIPAVAFLRVLRITKLLRGTGVQRLLTTLLLSARSFVNVTLLFMLNLFIFAAAGVVLFKDVRLTAPLTEYSNFQTVPRAFLLLFEIVTTEGWSDVMLATNLSPPNCSPTGEDCGSNVNVVYFLLFMVFGNFVTLQLFVAVIVETFEEADGVDEDLDELEWGHETPADILNAFNDLRGIWAERFGKKQFRVSVSDVVALLPYLPSTLTMTGEEPKTPGNPTEEGDLDNAVCLDVAERPKIPHNLLKEIPFLIRFLASLALPVDSEGMVQYRDVVYSLAYRKFNIDVRTYGNKLHTAIFVFQTSFTAAEEFCSHMIQKRWRLYQRAKKKERAKATRSNNM